MLVLNWYQLTINFNQNPECSRYFPINVIFITIRLSLHSYHTISNRSAFLLLEPIKFPELSPKVDKKPKCRRSRVSENLLQIEAAPNPNDQDTSSDVENATHWAVINGNHGYSFTVQETRDEGRKNWGSFAKSWTNRWERFYIYYWSFDSRINGLSSIRKTVSSTFSGVTRSHLCTITL